MTKIRSKLVLFLIINLSINCSPNDNTSKALICLNQCRELVQFAPREIILKRLLDLYLKIIDNRFNASEWPLASKRLNFYSKKPVFVRDQKEITYSNGTSETIYTNGLAGCMALALVARFCDGSSYAMLSHYPPISEDQQVEGLKRALRSIFGKEVKSKNLIACVPGKWQRDSDGKWSIYDTKDSYLSFIQRLKYEFGAEPIISNYSEFESLERLNYPDFMVTLEQDGATWRSFGDCHIPHKID